MSEMSVWYCWLVFSFVVLFLLLCKCHSLSFFQTKTYNCGFLEIAYNMFLKWSSLEASVFVGVQLTLVKYRSYKRFMFAGTPGKQRTNSKTIRVKTHFIYVGYISRSLKVCLLCRDSWGVMQECKSVLRKAGRWHKTTKNNLWEFRSTFVFGSLLYIF